MTDVDSGGPAAAANLQTGDLIVEADRKRVNDVAELQRTVTQAKDRILLLIKRRSASMFVVLRLK